MNKHLLLPFSGAFVFTTFALNTFANVYVAADRTHEGFEVGASLLLLQSELSSDLTQYAIFDTVNYNIVTEETKITNMNDKNVFGLYDVGFDVFMGYVWKNGQDLFIEYTYYQDQGGSSSTCEFESHTNYQNCSAYPSGQHFHGDASGHFSTMLNEADVLFGQRFIIGERMDLHFFAGVTAAWIKVGIDQHYEELRGFNIDTGSYMDASYDSDFRGIGPKVGFDGAYQIARSPIYIFMGASVAGLVGQTSAQSSEFIFDPEGTDTGLTTYDGGEENSFVPNLNAEIGLLYEYKISKKYTAEVMLGYMVSEYYDAVRHLAPYGASTGDGGTPEYNNTLIESNSNYSLNGPYLTLSALF